MSDNRKSGIPIGFGSEFQSEPFVDKRHRSRYMLRPRISHSSREAADRMESGDEDSRASTMPSKVKDSLDLHLNQANISPDIPRSDIDSVSDTRENRYMLRRRSSHSNQQNINRSVLHGHDGDVISSCKQEKNSQNVLQSKDAHDQTNEESISAGENHSQSNQENSCLDMTQSIREDINISYSTNSKNILLNKSYNVDYAEAEDNSNNKNSATELDSEQDPKVRNNRENEPRNMNDFTGQLEYHETSGEWVNTTPQEYDNSVESENETMDGVENFEGHNMVNYEGGVDTADEDDYFSSMDSGDEDDIVVPYRNNYAEFLKVCDNATDTEDEEDGNNSSDIDAASQYFDDTVGTETCLDTEDEDANDIYFDTEDEDANDNCFDTEDEDDNDESHETNDEDENMAHVNIGPAVGRGATDNDEEEDGNSGEDDDQMWDMFDATELPNLEQIAKSFTVNPETNEIDNKIRGEDKEAEMKSNNSKRRRQRRTFDFHKRRRKPKMQTPRRTAVRRQPFRIQKKRFQLLKSLDNQDSLKEGKYLALRNDKWYVAEVYAKRIKKGTTSIEYFVHYDSCDKRLDRWLPRECLKDIPQQLLENVEDEKEKIGSDKEQNRRCRERRALNSESSSRIKELDAAADEREREHEMMTRVKYISEIQMGKYIIETWYHSPYPDEYEFEPKLWICEFCLKYSRYALFVKFHKNDCGYKSPPGKPIYFKNDVCIYEVDGASSKMYCQHLCLLAKLFIDHKTVFYDISSFLFYVLCKVDRKGAHIVGYFSKEKDSAENNNVACILVLPPYQKNGYGSLLISFSYELSKIERLVAGPERPLSDLGLLAYRLYWSFAIMKELGKYKNNVDENHERLISFDELSKRTSIMKKDIVETLQWMNLLRYEEWTDTVVITPVMIKCYLKSCKRPKIQIDNTAIRWKPHL